ncbi:MAG: sigma factor-like helix-turn-helix DNA-binding protein [Thermoleophilia bacterium]
MSGGCNRGDPAGHLGCDDSRPPHTQPPRSAPGAVRCGLPRPLRGAAALRPPGRRRRSRRRRERRLRRALAPPRRGARGRRARLAPRRRPSRRRERAPRGRPAGRARRRARRRGRARRRRLGARRRLARRARARGLSASDRELLLLSVWDGLEPAQVAAALGASRATVAVRLHRARGRFRAAYERHEHVVLVPATSAEGGIDAR